MNLDASPRTRSQRWDAAALRSGAIVAIGIALPVTLLAAGLSDDNGGLRTVLFFGAMVGFVLGAGCAAWVQQVGTPLSHGVVAATGAYVGVQTIFVIVKLVRGGTVNWYSVFFTFGLVAVSGLIGGVLGGRLQARGITPSTTRSGRTS